MQSLLKNNLNNLSLDGKFSAFFFVLGVVILSLDLVVEYALCYCYVYDHEVNDF